MSLVITAILLLLCAAFAKMEGVNDAAEIDRLNKLPFTPKELNHRQLLTFRLIICGGLVAGCTAALVIWTDQPWWHGVYFAGMAYGMFTPIHRCALNQARGLDWRYVAPWGNNYDRAFYRIVFRRWDMPPEWLREAAHLYSSKEPVVRDTVHRAGLYAYITEAFTLCLSVILLLFT